MYANANAISGGSRVDVHDDGLSAEGWQTLVHQCRVLAAQYVRPFDVGRPEDSLVGNAEDKTVCEIAEARQDGEERCRYDRRQEIVAVAGYRLP